MTEPGTLLEPARSLDADRLADGVAVQALLRCWVRETGLPVPANGGILQVPFPAAGVTVSAEVAYQSATGWHRWHRPALADAGSLNAARLAELIVQQVTESSHRPSDLVEQVTDSTRRLGRYLQARATAPDAGVGLPPVPPFLAAEQALVTGHPLHPTPKSRTGLSEQDEVGAAPELRGAAPLHWFAADQELVRHGCAAGDSAPDRVAALAGGLTAPAGMTLVPAHPWQARALLTRPGVQELIGSGSLRALGPAGPPWSATSSVRTVYRADAPLMLKLSLGVRITNSCREHLVPELIRGAEMYALTEAGLGAMIEAAFPRFRMLGDPAWLAVTLPGETPDGPAALAVSCRDNPFGPAARVACLAGLVADRPDLANPRCRLALLIDGLAAATGRPVAETAVTWLRRYVDEVIAPLAWLHGVHGLGLEAHQQNTVVSIDPAGWPAGGWYRDNQGYYLSPTRAGSLHALLPGLGGASDAVNPDDVIDERVTYYVGVNNLLGVIGALGSAGLADEVTLLRAARAALRAHRYGFVNTLLDAPELPCKANLLTRVAGLDELVGPVETQSVYIEIANPFTEVSV